ncbi:MAG: S8 family serine peptidase [Pseudomonadota bacterium]
MIEMSWRRITAFLCVLLFLPSHALGSIWVRSAAQLTPQTHRELALAGKPLYIEVKRENATIRNTIEKYCGEINEAVTTELVDVFVDINFGKEYFAEYYPAIKIADRGGVSKAPLKKGTFYAVPFCLPVIRDNFFTSVRSEETLNDIALRETGFIGVGTKSIFLSENKENFTAASLPRAEVKDLADAFSAQLVRGSQIIVPYRSQPVQFRTGQGAETDAAAFLNIVEKDPSLSQSDLEKYRYALTREGQIRLRNTLTEQQEAPTQFVFDGNWTRIAANTSIFDTERLVVANVPDACIYEEAPEKLVAGGNCSTRLVNLDFDSGSNELANSGPSARAPIAHIGVVDESISDGPGYETIPLTSETPEQNSGDDAGELTCKSKEYYPTFFASMDNFDAEFNQQLARATHLSEPKATIAVVDNGLDYTVFKYLDGQKTPHGQKKRHSIFPTRHFKLDNRECIAVKNQISIPESTPIDNVSHLLATQIRQSDGNQNNIKGDFYGLRALGAGGVSRGYSLGFPPSSPQADSRHGAQVLFAVLGGIWDRNVIIREPFDYISERPYAELTQEIVQRSISDNLCRQSAKSIQQKFINLGQGLGKNLIGGFDALDEAFSYSKENNVKVVNLSFGSRNYLPRFEATLRQLEEDILFVVAAGNLDSERQNAMRRNADLNELRDGNYPDLFPAKYGGHDGASHTNVITVGGLGTTETSKSDGTFFGNNRIDIYAPSLGLPNVDQQGSLTCKGGTSIATGIVTHVAARVGILLGDENNLTPPIDVKQRIAISGKSITGHGKIDRRFRLDPINALRVFDDIIVRRKGEPIYGKVTSRKIGDLCSNDIAALHAAKDFKRLDVIAADGPANEIAYAENNRLKWITCSPAAQISFTRDGASIAEFIDVDNIAYIIARSREL